MNNVLSVEELFAGRVFRVPDYQRGYAWESRQLRDFTEDIELLSVHREHYTGTVVLHAKSAETRLVDSEGKSYGVFEVVDGQQRLATIVMLLESIRREFASISTVDPALPLGIHRTYVAAREMGGLPLFKLHLNSDCDNYFVTAILSGEPHPEGAQISSEKRLADAQSLIGEFLSRQREAQGDGYVAWLTDLYLKVATRLKVTVYEVESDAEVGVIFELMNNRGKPLSELEKVKNYLLYAGTTVSGTHSLADAVNDSWAEILRQLMAAGLNLASDEDELLRAHWLAFYDPRPRVFDGSRSVKERFDVRAYIGRPDALLGDLKEYAQSLRNAAVCVCDARAPDGQGAFHDFRDGDRGEVRYWSSKLVRANVLAPFLPLLIGARLRFPGDAKVYIGIARLCETFAMRVYGLAGRRTDAGQKELIPLGYAMRAGDIGFSDGVLGLVEAILTYSPTANFHDQLRAQQDWYEWARLKYFLYEYEEYLASKHGATPKVSWDDVRRRERADTIEHVLPQTATDEYWKARFDESQCQRYTNDLGNLALTKDNASYGNKPFPVKRGHSGDDRPCYAESPFFMERELATFDNWSPDEIDRRRTRLVEWATERWGLGELERQARSVVPAPPDIAFESEESAAEGETTE